MRRCDSLAIVANTSEDFPDPLTPVNTVRRRFGMSTLMFFRLFSRAPTTRIISCESAMWMPDASVMGSSRSERPFIVPTIEDTALPRSCSAFGDQGGRCSSGRVGDGWVDREVVAEDAGWIELRLDPAQASQSLGREG